MSLSFGSSKKKTTTSQDVDPWDPTINPLTQLVGQINGIQGNVGATQNQQDAFNQLFQNAAAGNPYEGQIGQLAGDLFNSDSRSGQVEDAYNKLATQLGGAADPNSVDPNNNPYIQKALQLNSDDIQNRVNSMFAGAGRDLSGKNQQSLAYGISQGTIPALLQQYNTNVANQQGAANALYNAGSGAASTEQGLDTSAINQRLQGIPASQAAIDAQNYGPNTQLSLEQQLKQLPAEDLGRLEALLGPIAQLGGQSTGQSNTTGSSMGLGVSNLFGGLGTLFSTLSDERFKENKQKVGALKDGTPVHSFNYKGDPTPRIGVMAQEVEKKNPDAVTDVGGVKFVDYAKATAKSAAMTKRGK